MNINYFLECQISLCTKSVQRFCKQCVVFSAEKKLLVSAENPPAAHKHAVHEETGFIINAVFRSEASF